jgi:L-ascorbate metabolism protein UlaG (beta-lactamase superfamily)
MHQIPVFPFYSPFFGYVKYNILIVSANDYHHPAASTGVDYRWLQNAGFEVILQSGAHVLVDPYLKKSGLTPQSFERADYILLTHEHSDHAQDVGIIQRQFPDARIFMGGFAANDWVKSQDTILAPLPIIPPLTASRFNTSRFYRCYDGQVFKFDDVTIQVFFSRHIESVFGNFGNPIDMLNYLITAADGTKFMVWGGSPSEDQVWAMKGINPDLMIMHISPKQDIHMWARIARETNPLILMPHHYDIWPTILRGNPNEALNFPAEIRDGLTPENVIQRMMAYVSKSIAADGVSAYYYTPLLQQWYHYDRHGLIAPDGKIIWQPT